MRVEWLNGIYIEYEGLRILIDPVKTPHKRVDLAIISHAHSDHVNPNVIRKMRRLEFYMTEPTAKLLFRRTPDNVRIVYDGFEFKGVEFKLLDSGHIIGSKAIMIDDRILYTGDFCTEARIILNPLRQVKAETLIIEATYGCDRYVFKDRIRLYSDLLKMTKFFYEADKLVVFGARSPGVAQEIIALLNHSKIDYEELYVDGKVYSNSIVHFTYEPIATRFKKRDAVPKRGIYITNIDSALKLRALAVKSIIASGLTLDWGLPLTIELSSHADFWGLVEYAVNTGAEKIYTVYGHSVELAQELRDRGFDAEPLDKMKTI